LTHDPVYPSRVKSRQTGTSSPGARPAIDTERAAALPSIDPGLAVRIIVRFIRQEAERAGFSRLVVGLSGGLDSAVALKLSAQALGAANTLAVALPYRDSAPESLDLAEQVARETGVRLETIPITPMADPYLARLPAADRVRRGNVLARLRMVVLYDLSARDRALVCGTSNKTELLLGYTTVHGDSACALQPIGDLYKTQVRVVGEYLGVPAAILERAPSADLWEGQTDEGDLGFTYAEADRLLARLVDGRLSVARLIEEGFDPALVRRLRQRIRKSQFKRSLPAVAKLSERSVGIDFRYPRNWDGWPGE
jgi:NAD+ synthase